jgi:hypothetical protein
MLPSIRLVIAAIFTTVMLIMGGFWLTSTFQIAKTSTGVPPHGSPRLDPALAEGSERKQIHALTGTQRTNEISLAVDLLAMNTRVTATGRFNHEDTLIEAPANNDGATSVINLVSPSRSDDSDQTASIASRPGPAPTAARVVALTEDVATVTDSPRTNPDAAITPTASADRPLGGAAIAAETPTNGGDEPITSTAPHATVLAIPSTTLRDSIAAADLPTVGDTAEETSPSRIAREVTAAEPPSIASEKTLAPSASRTAAEETVPSLASTVNSERVTPNPSSTIAVEEAAIPTPGGESPKATAPKATPNAAKPHAQATKAKAHQATTSKAGTKTAAHLRTRRVHHTTQSRAQPQNPANPFGNFFGSQ